MKNYASIYAAPNDSSAIEQRFYLKTEAVSGAMETPGNTDHFTHLPGGSITFEQPWESSPQRSGRHHSSIIKKKKVTNYSFSTFFNIDEGAGDGKTSIDAPMKALWKSLFGKEDVTGASAIYDSSIAPSGTFTLVETGDLWSRQSPGCFVNSATINLPGDGEATSEFSGMGATTFVCGIGESIGSNAGGNTVTLQAGEGKKFTVGGYVMLVLADGVTRSADTAAGTSRKITLIAGDVITVDGAALADVATDNLLVYYEADAPTAIVNPVTGLVGSVGIVGLSAQCIRNLSISINNNHEILDYCYGLDGLAPNSFLAGDRITHELTLDMNLNHETLKFFNGLSEFTTEDISAVLGDVTGRHFALDIPQARFQVPGFSVPDTGSIPVSYSGTAFESALGLADEFTASFN